MIPKINTRTFGSGPLPVLAIHCSLGHSGAWRGIGTALNDLATLHAFDLPGHGKSSNWDGQGDLHDVATDMALAVLDTLGPDPVDVLGHSFGAMIALRLAVQYPHRVRRLTLFEPVFFAAAMADDPDFAPAYARANAEFETVLEAGDLTAAASVFNAAWGDGTPWHAIPEATRTYMTDRIGFIRASAPFIVQDCVGLLGPNQLAKVQMPVLLLRGTTTNGTEAINNAIALRLPNATQMTLPEMGHMGPITHPDAVAIPVGRFLSAD
ncbi:alpha/beta fold hydrolase [Tateyamaria sp.]|uniref:alpha/beta fold hydrolase n=1 Tax=Tateyamaria sp. TaxID=1929288 RepID=UPI00329C4103